MAATEGLYTRLAHVGEGTYGVVYRVRHNETGIICALKKVRLDAEEEGVPTTALREISVLREVSMSPETTPASLGAENIVKLLDVLYDRSRLSLVFEYVDTDLKRFQDMMATRVRNQRPQTQDAAICDHHGYDWLRCKPGQARRDRALGADTVRRFSRHLLQGLTFLHARRLMHRDLKPHNLLISADGVLKIADFGLARALSIPLRTYTHEIVTLWYRAPEILLGARYYATSIDLWSVACIIAEMATGAPLFCGDSEIDQLFRIMRIMGTPTEEEWPGISSLADYQPIFPQFKAQPLNEILIQLGPDALDLVRAMLVYNPSSRITAKAALDHTYLMEESMGHASGSSTGECSAIECSSATLEVGSSSGDSTAPSSPMPPSSPCPHLVYSTQLLLMASPM